MNLVKVATWNVILRYVRMMYLQRPCKTVECEMKVVLTFLFRQVPAITVGPTANHNAFSQTTFVTCPFNIPVRCYLFIGLSLFMLVHQLMFLLKIKKVPRKEQNMR